MSDNPDRGDIPRRDDDDARADEAPPTDAVSDEVKADAASAGLSAEDKQRLAGGELDELPPPPPTGSD
ncbi:hypothetical protein [Microbacterium sp. 10M-3C3]|uniref:hypothetical protein n=1 Tax=Microbacterium sp. 10M-3C3 TaxID=2483401 RepID=UPI000F6410CF|nr:hypothetical protein [Microbacterium sp. 10M-3C3]